MTVIGSWGVRHATLLALLAGCTFDLEVGKSAVQVPSDGGDASDSDAREMTSTDAIPPLTPRPDAGLQGGFSGQGGDGAMRLVDGGAAGAGGAGAGGTAGMGAGGSPMMDAGAVTSATCTPNVAATSQVAFFDFNEGRGSVIGNRWGNAGSVSPAPANWIPGVAGGAVAFKTSAVIAPTYPLLDETGTGLTVSVSAWVKIDSISPGAQSILSRAEFGTNYEHFGLAIDDGRPAFKIHFFFVTSTELLPVGRWINLAATYDGITANLYVDGKPSATLDLGWPIAADTTPLVLGARQDSGGKLVDYFAGALDEVKVYKQVLTAADIATLTSCK